MGVVLPAQAGVSRWRAYGRGTVRCPPHAGGGEYERIDDRRLAIAFALSAAGPDDIVLVAGKGSEPHQIIGDQLLPFSDMAVVRQLGHELARSQGLSGVAVL